MEIVITAEILPGKEDIMAEAHFANASRAGQYAQMLADSGDYHVVNLCDSHGKVWVISPST